MQTAEMYFTASEDTSVGELAGLLGCHGVRGGHLLGKPRDFCPSVYLTSQSKEDFKKKF